LINVSRQAGRTSPLTIIWHHVTQNRVVALNLFKNAL